MGKPLLRAALLATALVLLSGCGTLGTIAYCVVHQNDINRKCQ